MSPSSHEPMNPTLQCGAKRDPADTRGNPEKIVMKKTPVVLQENIILFLFV